MKRFSDRLVLLAILIWSAVSFGSLAYHILDSNKHIENIARETAREYIEKDSLYRLWAAEHGGVYVPVTPKTRPNPYLSDVRERDIITPSGKWLTLVNPAYMTRQVHELSAERGGITAHITSLRPLRPENKPDEWEAGALKAIEAGKEDYGEVVMINGSSRYRLMLPLKIEEACLKCHAAQGYKVGDIRGGLSAAVPMTRFSSIQKSHIIEEIEHFGFVWVLGIAGIFVGSHYARKHIAERDIAESNLKRSKARLVEAQKVGKIGDWETDIRTNTLTWSDETYHILGMKPDRSVVLKVDDFIRRVHPDDEKRVKEFLKNTAEKAITSWQMEYRIILDRGEGRDVFVSARVEIDAHGRPVRRHGIVQDITDRKRLESALRLQSYIAGNISEGVYLVSVRDLTILYANPRMETMFGYEPGEMNGRHVSIINAPSGGDPVRVAGEIEDTLALTGAYRGDVLNIRKDGTTFWGHTSISKSHHPEFGEIYVSLQSDISDSKKAEQALRESEARLREAEKIGNIGNWEYDFSSDTLTWSDQAYSIFGIDSAGGISFKAFISRIHPDDRDRVEKSIRQAIDDRISPWEIEYRIICGNCQERHVFESGRIDVTATGRHVRRGIVQDITDRKRAESALRESEKTLRTIVDAEPECVKLISPEGKLIMMNPAGLAMIDADSLDMVKDRQVDSLVAEEYREAFNKLGTEVLKGKEGMLEFEIVGLKGRRLWMETHAVPLRDENGAIYALLAITRDITERKKASAQQRKLEEQLLQAQKMEAIGMLAGGIAHDFNNMLQAIMHYASLLKMQGKDTALKEEFIEGIISTSQRAAQLTQGLLAYSRKQRLDLKPADINDIVQDTEKMLRRIIGEDIVLVARLCPKSLVAMVDAGQLQQILVNLAANARDAMPRGGNLTIGTDIGQVSEEFHGLQGHDTSAEYAYITVTDTGEGMDEAICARIFDPFFTTKEIGRGTGLGLAIVYGTVKQHRGFIRCQSHKGFGTTFTIELPLLRVAKAGTAKKQAQDLLRGKETILIAEDEDVVRKATKLILESAGYGVLEASDGLDAVEKYRDNRHIIDLLLLDVVMPRCNGKEAYEEIRRINPDAPVCFISGYADDVISNRVTLEGNFQCIAKPISPEELLRRIREILDSSS